MSESLREDIQRAERDKADLRAAADRERAERERREQDLRSREGSENSEMAGLRTEINRVLEEKRGLTITLDGQRGEINKLQDELRARQKKIDDLKEEVDDLKEEIRDKDEEMDKLKGELDERLREAERLKGHVEEHSDKVEKLREELTIKTGELIERERADKTEVGKENLLQQKTTKLEKMVRDMHVELNVKKQSLKKAIKQSEQVSELSSVSKKGGLTFLFSVSCVCVCVVLMQQKEMEIRRLKDKVENLKRQLDEMESGKKDSESDSESESEDEDSDEKKKKKSKKSKKSKDDDDDDDDDDGKDDGKNIKKTLKKLEIKKGTHVLLPHSPDKHTVRPLANATLSRADVLKQRLEKLDMVEKTILAVEVRRKDEGRGNADRDDSDVRHHHFLLSLLQPTIRSMGVRPHIVALRYRPNRMSGSLAMVATPSKWRKTSSGSSKRTVSSTRTTRTSTCSTTSSTPSMLRSSGVWATRSTRPTTFRWCRH